jgi:hypothetical protein
MVLSLKRWKSRTLPGFVAGAREQGAHSQFQTLAFCSEVRIHDASAVRPFGGFCLRFAFRPLLVARDGAAR